MNFIKTQILHQKEKIDFEISCNLEQNFSVKFSKVNSVYTFSSLCVKISYPPKLSIFFRKKTISRSLFENFYDLLSTASNLNTQNFASLRAKRDSIT